MFRELCIVPNCMVVRIMDALCKQLEIREDGGVDRVFCKQLKLGAMKNFLCSRLTAIETSGAVCSCLKGWLLKTDETLLYKGTP